MPRSLLKSSRLVHLYFGVFITPALLFFAISGALQTFGLHESNRDHPNYKPAHWIAVIAQLHKKQTAILPNRRQPAPGAPAQAAPRSTSDSPYKDHTPGPAQADRSSGHASDAANTRPTPDAPPPQPASRHPLPLRIFFLIVSFGLLTSTITGLYMSCAYVRNKRLITLTLIAGIVIPLILVYV